MKPVEQNVFSDLVAGTKGNCFQAVIASMLELPLGAVPHFLHDGCGMVEMRTRVNAFLRPMNLAFIDIYPLALDEWGIAGLHHDLSGYSPRGIYHATCGHDGVMTHDPHPTHVGLVAPEQWGVFVVLDPSKPIGARQ